MNDLKVLLRDCDEELWPLLRSRTQTAKSVSELIALSNLRKRANAVMPRTVDPTREVISKIALVGGSTLYPLSELVEHSIATTIGPVELLTGEFNNFRSELLDSSAEIDAFTPSIFIVIPDDKSCAYSGSLTDSKIDIRDEAENVAKHLLQLCEAAHAKHGSEIILCNYLPSAFHDLGEFGSKSPASDWNFKRTVNMAMVERSPNYVHVCDLEFLAYRDGGLTSRDDRSWFESKQAFSSSMQVAVAKEIAHIISSLKTTPKKVLVLDLDNTLWGGVVGDDGIEGIEIGDTSPRGEAFKAFQSYIHSLIDRGILLGVCSKNDHENAIEPFRVHPEMVLREEHFVSFKANWEPKAANLIAMAEELSLGLDSFIFVDDNPAEIEIVNQFAPDVTTILLSDDPSEYVRQLQESRLFERAVITREDSDRTQQYRQEADRRKMESSVVDMDSYLESLEMVGTIKDFDRLDLPRIAQLINKSNQFNLTTRRRTEGEVEFLMTDPNYSAFTVRLADRFGDHGLISIVVCQILSNRILEIDTWLMSCRVLKRQVEHEVLTEIVRRAGSLGCDVIRARYIPTAKNGMVRDLLPSLGFRTLSSSEQGSEFELLIEEFEKPSTFIAVSADPIHHAKQRTNTRPATVNL